MDRRRSLRVPIQVWVEQWAEGELYVQQSANLSRGGIYLERTTPLPVGTLINLRFNLPGAQKAIEVKGRIAFPQAGGVEPGMGVEFVQLAPDTAALINAYLEERAPKEDEAKSDEAPEPKGDEAKSDEAPEPQGAEASEKVP